MKLIKTMLVGVFVLSMIFAQQNPPASGQNPPPGGNQGGPPPGGNPGGPPPGGNPGGPPPGGNPGGPPPGGNPGGDYQGDYDGDDQGPKFEDVDTDGDGLISREEARAVYGKDDEGNDDPNFDDAYNDVDANGDGMVDPNEHMMAESRDDDGDHDGDDYGNDHDGDDYGNDHDGNDHDGGDHGSMGGPMGPNFDEANCMALEHNSPEFWVDHNQNGEKDTVTMDDVAGTDYEGEPWKSPDYEGPYGTYHEYEDGSPVDCGGGNHQGGNQGGNHQGGNQGGPGGPDAPSQAVVNAWMSGAQEGGGFNFDAAFNAAEAQAKAEAQAEGEYFGDDAWNQCSDAGRAAMQEARDDNKSPQEVFQYVGQAVNACGEAQAAANQD